MKVMKFGGTSVGSIESLLNLKNIVNAEQRPVVVVVSAMGGFTNQLLAMCEQAQQRDISCLDTLEAARKRHHDAVDGVVIEPMRQQVHDTIDRFIDESLKPYYLMRLNECATPLSLMARYCHRPSWLACSRTALPTCHSTTCAHAPMLAGVSSTGTRPLGLSRQILPTWAMACMWCRGLSHETRSQVL